MTRKGHDSELSYFTHQIDGADYGGWYRDLAPDCIEVLSVGLIRSSLRWQYFNVEPPTA